MIIHLKLVLLTIFLIETLTIFKIFESIAKLTKILKKLLKLFVLKNISDHWKEKALFNYSKKIFIFSFKIMLFFISIIVIYLLILPYNINLNIHLFSIFGISETIVIVFTYLQLKKLL